MSQTTPSAQPPPSGPHHDDERRAWAAGGTVFAGVLLVVAGIMAVLEGIVGIAKDSVFVVSGGYAYKFNVTAWGWIHLVIGVLAVLVGLGLLRGEAWSRYAGIGIASIALLANFMFLPYQPAWSLIMIGIYVFIIWSLATYHSKRGHHLGGAR
ncbi:hypothetical protein OG900_24545 [Streptomyces sp. NBC_00433]